MLNTPIRTTRDLQEHIDAVLMEFEYEMNDYIMRIRLVDKMCSVLRDCLPFGHNHEFVVVCDESNNPPDIIAAYDVVVTVVVANSHVLSRCLPISITTKFSEAYSRTMRRRKIKHMYEITADIANKCENVEVTVAKNRGSGVTEIDVYIRPFVPIESIAFSLERDVQWFFFSES